MEFNCHAVAMRLGMTVDELGQRMSWMELLSWLKFFREANEMNNRPPTSEPANKGPNLMEMDPAQLAAIYKDR